MSGVMVIGFWAVFLGEEAIRAERLNPAIFMKD